MFAVAVLLGEDAAAVFLHIEAELAGFGLPLAEANAKVAVEKLHAVEVGGTLAGLDELLVLLVGRDEEGGGEGVEAVLLGALGRLANALGVAVIDAAVRNIRGHIAAEFVEAVIFADDKLGVDAFCVIFEAVAAGPILHVRVDVGIVPKKRGLDAFRAEAVDTVNAAGCAAGVHEEFHVIYYISDENRVQ